MCWTRSVEREVQRKKPVAAHVVLFMFLRWLFLWLFFPLQINHLFLVDAVIYRSLCSKNEPAYSRFRGKSPNSNCSPWNGSKQFWCIDLWNRPWWRHWDNFRHLCYVPKIKALVLFGHTVWNTCASHSSVDAKICPPNSYVNSRILWVTEKVLEL